VGVPVAAEGRTSSRSSSCPGSGDQASFSLPPRPTLRTHNLTEVKATKEEMDKAQIDLSLRDACAHLLIPLNK